MTAGADGLRVVLVDDSVLFRSGIAALLREAGLQVVGEASDVDGAFRAVDECRPDVVVLDVRMPPTHTDEGVDAAIALRERFAGLGVLVLSTYAESQWVERLLAGGADRLGYLLKDRVDDVAVLLDALRRLAAGGTAVDADVVARLVRARARTGALDRLTQREREVLALMAEGLSNNGIARRMYLSAKTVEAHIAAIFEALDLANGGDVNRRVRAVVAFLRTTR